MSSSFAHAASVESARVAQAAAPAGRPAHRPSAREAMLDAAEAHLGADGTLTLDSAARAAGVTKPGLMYHFATKELLLSAILDRMSRRYEAGMIACVDHAPARVGADPSHGSTEDAEQIQHDFSAIPASARHLAYLRWACQAQLSPADLVIFADPHLRVILTSKWQGQLDRWLAIPAGVPRTQQDHLLAVRLMADGAWFDRASGLLDIGPERVTALQLLAEEMLGGVA